MLRLSTAKREPFWLDASNIDAEARIDGFRVQVRPISLAMIVAARNAGASAILEAANAGNPDSNVAGAVAFVRSIARAGIVAWEGIGDSEGNPVEPSAETIDAALEDWRVYDFLDRQYVGPGLVRTDEKNASSPSRNGTTGAKTRAKGSANIARSRARTAHTI